jgi:hypothetical protein
LKHVHLIPLFVFVSLSTTEAQTDYPHAEEPIGTVRQVYDGALMPDIQVNTFRNIDRLFSTRVVKHGSNVYPLLAELRQSQSTSENDCS